jgi:hypothetical protein
MSVSKRVAPVALAAVALALTLTGAIYAATDANPAAIPKDPLALHGYPPKTANLQITVSTGQAYNLTANVVVNFRKNQVEAQLLVPLLFSATAVDLRLVHGDLYVGSPNLSSIFDASWITTHVSTPSFFGLSLELTKPDISLISGFNKKSTTKSGYLTTYRFQRDNVILTTPSKSPIKMPASATVDISITVGGQGEFTSATVSETSKTSTLKLTLNVLTYNQPTHIVAPPASDVKPVSSAALQKLLNETPLKGLLSMKDLGSLGTIQLN